MGAARGRARGDSRLGPHHRHAARGRAALPLRAQHRRLVLHRPSLGRAADREDASDRGRSREPCRRDDRVGRRRNTVPGSGTAAAATITCESERGHVRPSPPAARHRRTRCRRARLLRDRGRPDPARDGNSRRSSRTDSASRISNGSKPTGRSSRRSCRSSAASSASPTAAASTCSISAARSPRTSRAIRCPAPRRCRSRR